MNYKSLPSASIFGHLLDQWALSSNMGLAAGMQGHDSGRGG